MQRTYPMAFVVAPGRIEFREQELPDRGSRSVLVRVRAACICGSDLHIFRGKHPRTSLPSAVGHEVAGEVLEVGKEVTRVAPGDQVALEPVIRCGTCAYCRSGQYNYCPHLSRPHQKGQGAFTPFLVVDEEWAHKLPAGLPLEQGTLVEPLAVAVHAVKRGQVRFGQTAAVLGAGPIGLLLLQVARLAGMAPIFVTDLRDFRLDTARKLGASHVINPARQRPAELVREMTGGLGVDRAFEAVGSKQTLADCMHVLRTGGTGVVVGLYEDENVGIPANLITTREISLIGSRGYCWDFDEAIALLERGAVELAGIITHRMPLLELQRAFELLLDPEAEANKAMIQIS